MLVAASQIFDALIIGGGPAGLSAALALGRVKRSALVFDSGIYRNSGVKAMHTVLGNDGTNPQEFRAIGRNQIESKYNSIQFSNSTIGEVARVKLDPDQYDGFSAKSDGGMTYFGRKLIIATGSADVIPTDIPGYRENWPSHIYQCLYCDGFEQQDKPIGILSFSSPAYLGLALMALKFNPSVTIYSNGPPNPSRDTALQKAFDTALAAGVKLDTRRVQKLINDGEQGISVAFEKGDNAQLGMLLDKPATRAAGQKFIDQLGLEMAAPTGEVKVDPLFSEASVPGVFVPGDAGQLLKQVAVSMGTGVRAASGVSYQLCNEEGAKALAANGTMNGEKKKAGI
ncbi:hypothetical protein COCVIDRAFT_11166 [Bipolaris victoriae FI3]|uniref:FAD/NAD(P)-binding domain-containing protein n=1 Tax=Bipolaris victoriae (strain FI3) TaxID=930091 RepID=W7FA74_BIPV3|nr:hypothetical protein COCVIDRAFT_11166 [Bipolaris victoriae FI3]